MNGTVQSPSDDVIVTSGLSAAERRKVERLAATGVFSRIFKGVYVNAEGGSDEVQRRVRSRWMDIGGTLIPGGVVSHISAMRGQTQESVWTVSHPTLVRKRLELPGLAFQVVKGPGPLPGDMPLGQSGLYWASQARMLLENLGRKAPRRVGQEEVEAWLIKHLNASGEQFLNDLRDKAASLAERLGMQAQLEILRSLIGELLGTHEKGELKTHDGMLISQGKSVDRDRMERFGLLANYLRGAALPRIEEVVPAGVPRHNRAFIESYFSNYVEGTKFAIEDARDIVMHQRVMPTRPKDSHDILGVFQLAVEAPYRYSPPIAGEEFLPMLQDWHARMLHARPEASPGSIKTRVNYAGTTQFVSPSHVRGTFEEGSRLAMTVPEGMPRAVFYLFLVAEIHPFEDGNGRVSRLVMNAELSRTGLHRIIVPTLFHPQFVDCLRKLTRDNEPADYVRSLAKMARWCAQFDYRDLDGVIENLKKTNAMEESPTQYQLLNIDGGRILAE
ncbi:Fic family protein [Paraburkholderia sediminicola]|uniref:Fic family protein n=1 Tax=Paraburkholderia sediminicola TaxID=458836 RepID=UPI0038B9A3A3